jgi:hypothetical protein
MQAKIWNYCFRIMTHPDPGGGGRGGNLYLSTLPPGIKSGFYKLRKDRGMPVGRQHPYYIFSFV